MNGAFTASKSSHQRGAGFDPTIGFAHRREGNHTPLVYDLMEPLRPVVDRNVLEFALSNTFTPGDFTINKSGGCRFNPNWQRLGYGWHPGTNTVWRNNRAISQTVSGQAKRISEDPKVRASRSKRYQVDRGNNVACEGLTREPPRA